MVQQACRRRCGGGGGAGAAARLGRQHSTPPPTSRLPDRHTGPRFSHRRCHCLAAVPPPLLGADEDGGKEPEQESRADELATELAAKGVNGEMITTLREDALKAKIWCAVAAAPSAPWAEVAGAAGTDSCSRLAVRLIARAGGGCVPLRAAPGACGGRATGLGCWRSCRRRRPTR